MKKTKIIIPALGMLLLSTAASVTGTVAWFAMNSTVTASGMNIQAKSDSAYLVVSEALNGTYDTDANSMVLSPAVDQQSGAPGLKLVTPLNVANNVAYYESLTNKNHKNNDEPDPITTTPTKFTNAASVLWGTTVSSDPAQVQANNVTDLVGGDGFENGSLENYVQISELFFKVKTVDANGTNLRCSKVTFADGTNSIAASGRVLLVSEEGKYQLFKLVDGEVTAAENGSDSALVATVTHNTASKVTCFFYFDGTDAAAYTDNATDLTGVTASFEFKIA